MTPERPATPERPDGDPRAPRPRAGAPDDQASSADRAHDSVGVNVFSYLLSGVLLFGGLGWLADRWLGTSFVVGIGALAGTALSLYYVWFRYGSAR